MVNYNTELSCSKLLPFDSNGYKVYNYGLTAKYSVANHRWLSIKENGVDVTISDIKDDLEKWTWIDLGNNKYAWLSAKGTFLSGSGKDSSVNAVPILNTWETWEKRVWGNNNFWKSFHGSYLSSSSEKKVSLKPSSATQELWRD